MFMARHWPLGRKVSERDALRLGTLERRQAFHFGEAIRAALQGSHDKAATHSGTALSISRELCTGAPDPAPYRAELAAALCNHARYGGTLHAIALLTESVGHYAALAQADPAVYEVPRIDVLARVALTADAAGNTAGAIRLLREAIRMYLKAPAADPAERDVGLARARFHLGRCLLKTGAEADGLAETDAGLALAEGAARRLRVPGRGPRWLATAPRYLQLAVPDWAAAAVRAMTLHAAAGRWDSAAAAARAAVRISGGLAGLGGDTLRETHEDIRARASVIRARAIRPRQAAAS
jgi:tetratricopeptide (TPR) repeat protein